uniref:PNPLA domain-containing protein n=1 Tax=Palpitomonas bilix TaxID=652834 RepID=A0A7S3G8H8_9EUKA|mmetsp:Transcript_30398/g.78613  ORF Transcript_30398/g.78613 Transcript_30398/m.78613 type:complete len:1041 (+) Transcript_30398:107-3229(+)
MSAAPSAPLDAVNGTREQTASNSILSHHVRITQLKRAISQGGAGEAEDIIAAENVVTNRGDRFNERKQGGQPGVVDNEYRLRVGLAVSGGGIRSLCFGSGVLRGVLSEGHEVSCVSGVSGGAFLGGSLFSFLSTSLQALSGKEEKDVQKFIDIENFFSHLRKNIGYLGDISALRGLGLFFPLAIVFLVLLLALFFWTTTVFPFSVMIVDILARPLAELSGGCDLYGSTSGGRNFSLSRTTAVGRGVAWFDEHFLRSLESIAQTPLARVSIVLLITSILWFVAEVVAARAGRETHVRSSRRWLAGAVFTTAKVLRSFFTFFALSITVMSIGEIAEFSAEASNAMDGAMVAVVIIFNLVKVNPTAAISKSNVIDVGMYISFVAVTGYLMRFVASGIIGRSLVCDDEGCLTSCTLCDGPELCVLNTTSSLFFGSVSFSPFTWSALSTASLFCLCIYPFLERGKLVVFHAFYEWRLRKSFLSYPHDSIVRRPHGPKSDFNFRERQTLLPLQGFGTPGGLAKLSRSLSFMASVVVNLWSRGASKKESRRISHNLGVEFHLKDAVLGARQPSDIPFSAPQPLSPKSVVLSEEGSTNLVSSMMSSRSSGNEASSSEAQGDIKARLRDPVPTLSKAVALSGAAVSIYNGTLSFAKGFRQAQASLGLGLGQWVDLSVKRSSLCSQLLSVGLTEVLEIGLFGVGGFVVIVLTLCRQWLVSAGIISLYWIDVTRYGVIVSLLVFPFVAVLVLSIFLREKVSSGGSRVRAAARALDRMIFIRQFRLLFGLSSREEDLPDLAYLSDGGHVENMGLSPLIGKWKQCIKEGVAGSSRPFDTIVVSDSSGDPKLSCKSFLKAVSHIQREYGVVVEGLRMEKGTIESIGLEKALADALTANKSSVLCKVSLPTDGIQESVPLLYCKPVRASTFFRDVYRTVRKELSTDGQVEKLWSSNLSSFKSYLLMESRKEGGVARMRNAARFGYLWRVPDWDPEKEKKKRRCLNALRTLSSCGRFPHETIINQFFFQTKFDAYHIRGLASLNEGVQNLHAMLKK